ncbi:TPA: histidine--tRNA ligase [Candidatus Berkelbacteria bacterium]|uniref:Histidine--tRNA ligase n=1 Tax=Berkelbacteria bacterium GW2011_GWE1_39_12 TaxID=1618337 RepID=A0A0G4B5W0_9BACT|nr:MAG: histidyl-tRNA synthetase, histidyl-tRNA synthetase [Berkelbacteria bacterium GW2011_GWE1_39_12]HBO60128.1 histidine--tRNA ligase [Candidatus Berkelbacteria bacterium]
MAENLQKPRGTKDILPDEQKYWQYVSQVVFDKCESFGCGKITTPMFEFAEVFTKSLGSSSDIVTKEMFEVRRAINPSLIEEGSETDKKTMVLRPEFTAAIVRSYIENGMKIWPQPVKLYYEGSCFRYERPQSGRYRQFNQFGVEVFGDIDPLIDASIIYLGYQILKKLGLAQNITIDINSVGCSTCRPKMRKKLTDYFEKFLPTLCTDCNKRFIENPLRILDCKEEKCQKVVEGAPQLVDMLCTECKTHFKSVLENLDIMQIPYNLNSKLVRGLDYYTKTVFEFYDSNDTARQSTLLGGGRYDNLIKMFGGSDTPAVGFGAGIERLVEKMKELEVEVPEGGRAEVSIIQIGDKARKKCLPLLNELEELGIKVTCIMGKDSLKSQLRMASRMKSKVSVIIGQREVLDNSAIVRDMIDGVQETVKMDKLIGILKGKLDKI